MVDACNQHTDYAGMAECAETGAHAWGHNAVGSVMQVRIITSPMSMTHLTD